MTLDLDDDRDPTDLGIRWVEPSPPMPREPEPDPEPGPPASAEHRAQAIAAAGAELGWRRGSARDQLAVRCSCGAPMGAWCYRPRRGAVIGFVHDYRGSGTSADVAIPPV